MRYLLFLVSFSCYLCSERPEVKGWKYREEVARFKDGTLKPRRLQFLERKAGLYDDNMLLLAVGIDSPPSLFRKNLPGQAGTVLGHSVEVFAQMVCPNLDMQCQLVVDDFNFCWGGDSKKAKSGVRDQKSTIILTGGVMSSDTSVLQTPGTGLMSFWYDGCLGWENTWLRQSSVRFSSAIGSPTSGGMLALKSAGISKTFGLSGMKIGVLQSWATNPISLQYVTNPNSGKPYDILSKDVISYGSPDALARALLAGEINVAYCFDTTIDDRQGCETPCDASLWNENATAQYTWLATGIKGFSANGISVFSRKDSRLPQLLNEKIPGVIGSDEFKALYQRTDYYGYDLTKVNALSTPNADVPLNMEPGGDQAFSDKKVLLAVGIDNYPDDFVEASAGAPFDIKGFSNEVWMLACKRAGLDCEFVVDDYNFCWAGDTHGPVLSSKTMQVVGSGIMNYWYDGCIGWVHTWLRDSAVQFSDAITSAPAAGILALKESLIDKNDTLAGKTVGAISGWAVNHRSLLYSKNPFNGIFFDETIVFKTFSGPDALIQALLDKTVVVAYLWDSTLQDRFNCPPPCDKKLYYTDVTDTMEWIHTGLTDYAKKGYALFARPDSTLPQQINKVLPRLLLSTEYQNLCVKYKKTNCLSRTPPSQSTPLIPGVDPMFSNKKVVLVAGADYPPWDYRVNLPGKPESVIGLSVDAWLLACKYTGLDCVLITDDYNRCWAGSSKSAVSSSPTLQLPGDGLMNGWYDGCIGWTNTYARQGSVSFSMDVTKNTEAGLLVMKHLNISKTSDLSGYKIGCIGAWATNAGSLEYIHNPFTGAFFKIDLDDVIDTYSSPDELMQALFDAKIHVAYMYTSIISDYSTCGSCKKHLYNQPFSQHYTFLHGGITDYAGGGNSLMARKDSPLIDRINRVIPSLLRSKEYEEMCQKYGKSSECKRKKGRRLANGERPSIADLIPERKLSMLPSPTKVLLAVGVNYAPFDYRENRVGAPESIVGFSNEIFMMACKAAGLDCEFVVDDYNWCWAGSSKRVVASSRDLATPGNGLMGYNYDGCPGWLNTYERQGSVKFSHAITQPLDAGLIALKNRMVRGDQNFSGWKVGTLESWATNKISIQFVVNPVTGEPFAFAEADILPFSDPDYLIKGLLDGKVDLAYLFSTTPFDRKDCKPPCSKKLWSGTNRAKYEFVFNNITGIQANGTSLMARKDSLLPEKLNKVLPGILASDEYKALCLSYKVTGCFGVAGPAEATVTTAPLEEVEEIEEYLAYETEAPETTTSWNGCNDYNCSCADDAQWTRWECLDPTAAPAAKETDAASSASVAITTLMFYTYIS